MRKLLLFLAFGCCYGNLYAQAGSLDPTFGYKGIVRSNLFYAGGAAIARKTFVQPDGTLLVVVQEGERTALTRFLSNGAFAGSFGFSTNISYGDAAVNSDGKVVVAGTNASEDHNFSVVGFGEFGDGCGTFSCGPIETDFGSSNDQATAVAIQKDGKIVVAGFTYLGGTAQFAIARFNADGSLDSSFSGDGKQVTSTGNHGAFATGIALQPDGKIIVCGYAGGYGAKTDFALVRYNENGTRDLTFSGDGKVLTTVGALNDRANAVALQPDGKILVTGTTQLSAGADSAYAMATVRYNSNGDPDPTFGTNGIAITPLGKIAEARSVLIQNDTKIIVAGDVNTGLAEDFAVLRYTSNGRLDASFSGDGRQQVDFFGRADRFSAATLWPDGKIVLTGWSEPFQGKQRAIALALVTTGGAADATFGNGGKVNQYYSTGSTEYNATAIQPDGKLLAVGYTQSEYYYEDFIRFALARYKPGGTFDSTFGTDGKVLTPFYYSWGSAGVSVALQRDGKSIVGGTIYDMEQEGPNSDDYLLVRYKTDGKIDSAFGTNGRVIIDFGGPNIEDNYDNLTAVAVQKDGKIVAVGTSDGAMSIARCHADGRLDSSFSDDGKLIIGFSGTNASGATAVAIQPNGKIVLAGTATLSANEMQVFALARINPNGSLDLTFSGDGKQLTAIGTSSKANAVVIQPDGKIVAAGTSNDNFALVRYTATGNLDKTFDNDGKVITGFGRVDVINALALQPDGKLVAGGTGDNQFALARYNTNGTLDSSFAGDGRQTTKIDTTHAEIRGIAIYGNRLYAVGAGAAYSGVVAAYRLDVPSPVTKTIKVNLFGGVNPYNNPEWNNWNNLKNLHTGPLYYSESSVSTITAVMSNRSGIKDNGETYGGGMAPAEVLRYTSYSVAPRTITFSGLSISKTYNIELYASRSAYPNDKTVFSVNGQTQTIATYQNVSSKAVFTNLHPDVQGELVITISSAATYNYLNSFILTEKNSSTQAVTQLKEANTIPAIITSNLEASISPNPTTESFTFKLTSNQQKTVQVRVVDAMGRLIEVLSTGAANATLQFGEGYTPGEYFAEVQQGGERKLLKLVKTHN